MATKPLWTDTACYDAFRAEFLFFDTKAVQGLYGA
jgi:hypothetical protein